MKAYLIGYDLDKPGQDYTALINRLTQHGASRVLYSTWALKTTWTAVRLRDDLRTYMDTNDRLLVTEIGEWAYWNIMSSERFQQIAA